MQAAQATVQRIVDEDQVVYGINTGFGKLASTRSPTTAWPSCSATWCCRTAWARAMRCPTAWCAGPGHQGREPGARAFGHSPGMVDALLALANADVLPVIPAKGSVGASGDLAPLAHLACVLIGEGRPRSTARWWRPEAMAPGWRPSCWAPRKGWRCSTARRCPPRWRWPACFGRGRSPPPGGGRLSLEAIKGSVKPFDARIHEARGQPGQIAVAAAVRACSTAAPSTLAPHCGRVQDPYSIRCVPQVMGACLDNLQHAARVLRIEANAASDNPLVFTDTAR
jgi:histidine ammonia-lyase